jgi:hypothetical protein
MAAGNLPPTIALYSDDAVRLAALHAVFPTACVWDVAQPADILLVDATAGETTANTKHARIVLTLAPTRPPNTPEHGSWIATPCSPATLVQHLARAWQERLRHTAGHRLQQHPPAWHAPDGSITALTEKEAQLLAALLDNPEGLTREHLLDRMWGMDAAMVETHALETQLYRLRQKLQATWGDGWFLGLRDGICLLEATKN